MHMRNFPTVAGAEVMFGFVWNDVWLLCDVVPHIWRLCERACRPDYWELVERMDSWVTARLKCEGGWCRLVRPVSDTGGESKRCWKAERCAPCVCLCVCPCDCVHKVSPLSHSDKPAAVQNTIHHECLRLYFLRYINLNIVDFFGTIPQIPL